MGRAVQTDPMPPKKKPFSNKQKKVQLQQKRQKKKDKVPFGSSPPKTPPNSNSGDESCIIIKQPTKPQPQSGEPHPQPAKTLNKHKGYNPTRFRLHFHQDDVERNKLLAKTIPISKRIEEELEVSINDVYQPGSLLDIPKRPPWDYSMSKEQVERREEEMFTKYVQDIFTNYSPQDLSYFELNLETWRQLWRVLEISDMILMITDIRHPALHFSPAMYKYIVEDLKKHLVLILNKVDLVPPQVAVAWRQYFIDQFPNLSVVCFSSFPNKEVSLDTTNKIKFKLRKKGGFKRAIGPKELYCIIEKIYKQTNFDMSLWQQKFDGISCKTESADITISDDDVSIDNTILTIGVIGHPNVGKSSLLNGIIEKKMVSTSRTPGHTKHFQTIFLTSNIRLCDCPGLVFPSLVSKQLQILSGIYPIAQVKEPYTVVGYLAERLPIITMLSLRHPNPPHNEDKGEIKWTPWDICDAWAERRGYYTRRGGKPDTYRAANDLLRLASDGRICLYFRPPGFSKQKSYWDSHPDVQYMIRLQTMGSDAMDDISDSGDSDSGDGDSDSGDSDSDSNESFSTQTKFSLLMNMNDTSDD